MKVVLRYKPNRKGSKWIEKTIPTKRKADYLASSKTWEKKWKKAQVWDIKKRGIYTEFDKDDF